MTDLAQDAPHVTAGGTRLEALKGAGLFCALSLIISLVALKTYGLDLSVAFF